MKIILTLFIIYLFLALLFYVFQTHVFFFPSTTPSDYTYNFPYTHEEVYITTHDQEQIHGLFFPQENTKGTILYFHGNAGSLASWGWIAEDFQNFNYDLLIIDYRTYGKSTGKLSEQNLYRDAQTVYDFVKMNKPDHEIIIYGRSIGTGVAVDLAAKLDPALLILEAPFTNLPDLAWQHFPGFPYHLLSRFQFRSDKKTGKINCPVHIFHGTIDKIIPDEFGKKLFQAFPPGQAEFYSIEGAGHNDVNDFEQYQKAIAAIFNN